MSYAKSILPESTSLLGTNSFIVPRNQSILVIHVDTRRNTNSFDLLLIGYQTLAPKVSSVSIRLPAFKTAILA